MGNRNSANDSTNTIEDFDFEKVEATSNPNDMTDSGILVEKPKQETPNRTPTTAYRRRIIKATAPVPSSTSTSVTASISSAESEDSSENNARSKKYLTIISNSNDERLLQESIEQERAKRMQKLAADQKTKRGKQQQQRREKPHSINAKANPFSKFLSAFSVEPKYPSHKRAHSSNDQKLDEPPPKLPRLDDYERKEHALPWRETIAFAAVGAVASLAAFLFFRRKK